MAKYNITHACGHTVTHQVYGTSKTRKAIVRQRETRDCAECRRAQQLAEAQAEARAVAQTAAYLRGKINDAYRSAEPDNIYGGVEDIYSRGNTLYINTYEYTDDNPLIAHHDVILQYTGYTPEQLYDIWAKRTA